MFPYLTVIVWVKELKVTLENIYLMQRNAVDEEDRNKKGGDFYALATFKLFLL